MKIEYSKKFVKQYEKADIKIREAFSKRLQLFLKNPLHPQLKNHPLKGTLAGYKSINITGDWRALYSETKDEESETIIIFDMLGTHSQLYKYWQA